MMNLWLNTGNKPLKGSLFVVFNCSYGTTSHLRNCPFQRGVSYLNELDVGYKRVKAHISLVLFDKEYHPMMNIWLNTVKKPLKGSLFFFCL